MRLICFFPCIFALGCATSTPEHQAGPLPASDASVEGAAESSTETGLDAPAYDSDPDPWPGGCDDGQVKECYTGPTGTKNVGACKSGTHVCVDGVFPKTCTGEVLPTEEVCNGIDDNCDGTVDEGCGCTEGEKKDCYGGPAGTEGVGTCQGGSQVCANGVWGACAGAVLPAAETCNGLDDDCNGLVDDKVGLRLYSKPFDGNTWTSKYLSEAWTGANAPPACADIMATAHVTDIERLLVFTADGKLYWRKSGTWMSPMAATSRFPSLPGTIDTVSQTPYSLYGEGKIGATLTFTAIPYAYAYSYDQNDSVAKKEEFPIQLKDGTSEGGPNQAKWRARWGVIRFDPALFGTSNDSYQLFIEYDDNRVYRFNAAFHWESWPIAQSPLWNGKANAPPVGQCIAGYEDHVPEIAYLICQ